MRSFTSALAGAAVAGIVVSGSFAIAAIPDATTKVITVCYKKTTGEMRVIDKAAKGACNIKTENELAFNQQGRQGDPGLPGVGIPGPKGDPGSPGVMSCANELALKQAVPAFTLTPSCEPPPPPLSPSKLAAGNSHSCALLADATVKCWGSNGSGQLGNGTTISSSTAVPVLGIAGATSISAGIDHTCAVLADTTVKCWGKNWYGALGDGTNTDSSTPVTVLGLTGATAIATGNSHSCALLADTTVKCWGYNYHGQLGNGATLTASSTPVTVLGLSGATAVSAGSIHSCALLVDATLKCWGSNEFGVLGDGTYTNSTTPVKASGIAGATAIASEYLHSCALLADATVKCWGYNYFGTLGNGTNIPIMNTPLTVTGITGVTAIDVGAYHSCALLWYSTVKCWGSNGFGQLGDGTTSNSNTPVKVSGLNGAVAIATGHYHSCAEFADATVKCWGSNGSGQLGNGATTDSNTPVSVIGL